MDIDIRPRVDRRTRGRDRRGVAPRWALCGAGSGVDSDQQALAVDGALLQGDIEYDLARILWTRLDEMTTDRIVTGPFDYRCAALGAT